jgi:predicted esterase
MRGLVLGLAAALGASVVILDAPPAAADPVPPPCAGCRLSLPPATSTEPIPLLVVLHGDWGVGPAELLAAWAPHALPLGVGVLALACPRDRGCQGSFWRWNGDPSWIDDAVAAVAAKRPIDRSRVWLAGWSGGASYMGLRAPQLQKTFAALVYHGGGIPPSEGGCGVIDPKRPSAPVYFLVGDGNPLHGLAVSLRDRHRACGDDVTWRLVPRADHGGEWRALGTEGDAIVRWLLTKRRAG